MADADDVHSKRRMADGAKDLHLHLREGVGEGAVHGSPQTSYLVTPRQRKPP